MAQQIRLVGWLDAAMPARWKESGLYEFRLKLSEEPAAAWKKAFSEQASTPAIAIDHDVLAVACELDEIEAVIRRIKQRLAQAHQAQVRAERESDERVAKQTLAAEEVRKKILSAVGNIRFDEP
ncbi:MAG TPA: hypothetical protein VNX47_04995 [Nevskia sp.]|jgi:hypothetical protein|nr:hypothetical protein [Nevskia sp.]